MNEEKPEPEETAPEESIADIDAVIKMANDKEQSRHDAISDSLMGGATEFAGMTLRPVTLSSLAMLERIKSPLVTGDEEGVDMITEALIFLWMQSADPDSVRAAVLTSNIDSRITLEARALELGDNLSLSVMDVLVDTVTSMMNAAVGNKVETIPEETDPSENAKPSKNK